LVQFELELIVVIGAITALVVTTVFNVITLRQTTKSRFSSLLKDYTHELTTILGKENELKSKEDCNIYVIAYGDTLESLAFMSLRKKIPPDIAKFFSRYYEYAGLLMDWYDEHDEGGEKSEKRWPDIQKWIKKEGIKKDTNKKFLPFAILNSDKIPKHNLKIEGV
jgi:hypothetical protein